MGSGINYLDHQADMIFNVLVKKEGALYVAHCLELDIVTASPDVKQLEKDMIDLIHTQIDYAFSHDNLENLYHPAPSEVWEAFFKCKKQMEIKHKIQPAFKENQKKFVPPWFTTRICDISRLNA